ncbi:BT4734/BF3469 family protein [Prevotella sp. P6B1]|uniref:BT4734/BF3469 family protein n=1 Tax=Prevotella sp. P6B1 TaxID=1410613 RepID=UPI0018CC4F9B|nr:BT4734/BF3469 family protein [Prevotella sp. P6B1]
MTIIRKEFRTLLGLVWPHDRRLLKEELKKIAHGMNVVYSDSDPEELETVFNRLKQDPHVLLMYHTISGKGLRIIYCYIRENNQKADDTSWRAQPRRQHRRLIVSLKKTNYLW